MGVAAMSCAAAGAARSLHPVSYPLSHETARGRVHFLYGVAEFSPENFAAIEALRRAYEDALCDILRVGIAEDAFDIPDPKLAAMAIIAMLTGVNTWYSEAGRLSLAEVEEIYWEMVRKAVAADRSA